MSWTPAVPPPPVEGAPTGTGLDVAVALTNGVGVTGEGVAEGDGEADRDGEALGVSLALELGPRAVVTPPLGDAGPPVAAEPLGEVQAVVAARMARAARGRGQPHTGACSNNGRTRPHGTSLDGCAIRVRRRQWPIFHWNIRLRE